MKFLLGTKEAMTQVFDDRGTVQAVTVIKAGPINVTQQKTIERDGYQATQVGYGRIHKEFPMAEHQISDEIKVGVFSEGEVVTVSGISKGKGFQGVVKRHRFAGGPRTHGQKHSEREPGSIGGGLRNRVPKGMRMAGRMGNDRVTVKNLRVVKIDEENNRLYIQGAVPGRRGTLLEIKSQDES